MDSLELLKKFKETIEVADLIDDITTPRKYFYSQEYEKMQEHIHKLSKKYYTETVCWNAMHTEQPKTFEQSYINTEYFLMFKSACIIIKSVNNYQQRLTSEEIKIFELILKL